MEKQNFDDTDERIAYYRNRLADAVQSTHDVTDFDALCCLRDLLESAQIGMDEWRELCLECEGSGVQSFVLWDGEREKQQCTNCSGNGFYWTDK